MKLSRHFGIATPFDPQHKLVTSPFFSPTVLASIRLSVAFYTFFTLLFVLIWDGVRLHSAQQFFSYFTELSNIGLCAYYWASGVQTASYARNGKTSYALQRWPRFLQLLHVFLQSTIVVMPIIVTAVFWALLSSPKIWSNKFSAWSNVSLHALNTVFALFEIFLTNSPPIRWLYLPPGVLILALYLALAYVTYATQSFYTYAFLNPSKEGPLLAAYIVGIAAAEVVIFIVVRYAMVLRQYLAVRHGRVDAWNGDEATLAPQALEEWEDIERPKSPISPVSKAEHQ